MLSFKDSGDNQQKGVPSTPIDNENIPTESPTTSNYSRTLPASHGPGDTEASKAAARRQRRISLGNRALRKKDDVRAGRKTGVGNCESIQEEESGSSWSTVEGDVVGDGGDDGENSGEGARQGGGEAGLERDSEAGGEPSSESEEVGFWELVASGERILNVREGDNGTTPPDETVLPRKKQSKGGCRGGSCVVS